MNYVQGKIGSTSGDEQAQWVAHQLLMSTEPKYGPGWTKANAFIVCDRVFPGTLKKALAQGLCDAAQSRQRKTGGNFDPVAGVLLPADAVIKMAEDGSLATLGTDLQIAFVEVAYAANQNQTRFAVLHWQDCGLASVEDHQKSKQGT